MDDTQSTHEEHRSVTESHPLVTLADVDPAEAPSFAERYAADLEAQLDAAGNTPTEGIESGTDPGAVT